MPEISSQWKPESVRARGSQREPEWESQRAMESILAYLNIVLLLNKTLFCCDASKYGIFCRKLLKYALWAKKMAASAIRAHSTLCPTLPHHAWKQIWQKYFQTRIIIFYCITFCFAFISIDKSIWTAISSALHPCHYLTNISALDTVIWICLREQIRIWIIFREIFHFLYL